MPVITDFDVTYGNALAPAGFHRVTKFDGQPADLDGRNPASLWTHEGASRGAPIVDLHVIYDDQPVPVGFDKVGRDMTKGSKGQSSFLCVRRAAPPSTSTTNKEDEDESAASSTTTEPPLLPIADVHIVHGDEEPAEGFTKLALPLNRGDGERPAVYLCYKRATEETLEAAVNDSWNALALKVGDAVDFKDAYGKWLAAEVVAVSDTSYRLHVKAYASSRWFEEVGKESSRIAAPGSKAMQGQYRVQGVRWDVSVKEILPFEEQVKSLLNSDVGAVLEDEATDRFVKVDFPNFVEACMSSSFADPAVAIRINNTLELAMHLVEKLLRTNVTEPLPQSILSTLSRFFDHDQNPPSWFYTHYGLGYQYDALLEGKEKYISVPSSTRHTQMISAFHVLNMNTWGAIGGYDAMLERFPYCPLAELHAYVMMLIVPLHFYVPAFAKTLFVKVAEAALPRLASPTNEELSHLKGNQQDLLEMIWRELDKALTKHYYPQDPPNVRELETALLEQCKRLLTCPYLNFRIKALTQLNELVDMSRRMESGRGMAYSRVQTSSTYSNPLYGGRKLSQLPTTRWLTPRYLADWLVEEEILEVVLGETEALKKYGLQETHYELVRRSEVGLKLVLDEKGLRERQLKALWAASTKHADSQRAVYKVLDSLVPELNVNLSESLYSYLREIPRPYEDFQVKLLMEVGQRVMEQHNKGQGTPSEGMDYGVGLLWDAVMDDKAPLKHQALEEALNAIVELIMRPEDERMTAHWCRKTVDSLGRAHHVLDCLKLLYRVGDQLPESPTRHYGGTGLLATKDAFFRWLEDEFSIMDMVVADVARYHGEAKAKAAQEGIIGSSELYERRLLEEGNPNSLFKHREELDLRLQYLTYEATSSHVLLTFAQLEMLWAVLVKEAICPQEPELLFTWMLNLTEDDRRSVNPPAVSKEVIREVFQRLLADPSGRSGLDVGKLGLNGYITWERYFRRVNVEARALGDTGDRVPPSVERFDDLFGFETLWETCVRAQDPQVAEEAAKFYIALHLRLYSTNPDRPKVWTSVVHGCMSRVLHILQHSQPSCQQEEDEDIRRVLTLLTRFLNLVEKPDAYLDYGHMRPDEVRVRADIRRLQNGRPSLQFDQTLHYQFQRQTVTLGAFRSLLAADLKVDGNLVRLIGPQRNVLYSERSDRMLLESIQGNNQIYEVCVLPRPEGDTAGYTEVQPAPCMDKEIRESRRHPRTLLSENLEYFNLLFRLLSRGPSIVQNAWDLIALLPINAQLAERIQTLDGAMETDDVTVDWEALLDGQCPLRLLYKLKMMDTVMDTGEDRHADEETQLKGIAWWERFVTTGGLRYLIDVLIGCDPVALCQTPLHQDSLTALIGLIHRFLTHHDTDAASAGSDGGNSDFEPVDTGRAPSPTLPDYNPWSPVEDAAREVMQQVDLRALGTKMCSIMLEVAKASEAVESTEKKGKEGEGARTPRGSGSVHGGTPAAAGSMYQTQNSRRSNSFGGGGIAALSNSSGGGGREMVRRLSSQRGLDWTSTDLFPLDASFTVTSNPSPPPAYTKLHMLARTCLVMLEEVVEREPALLAPIILDFPQLDDLILHGLVKSPSVLTRRLIAQGLHQMAVDARRGYKVDEEEYEEQKLTQGRDERPSDVVQGLLLSFVRLLSAVTEEEDEAGYVEFFAVMGRLLMAPRALVGVDTLDLARTLAGQIKRRKVVEAGEEDCDEALRGVMSALRALLSFVEQEAAYDIKVAVGSSAPGCEGLLWELFHACLFAMPTAEAGNRVAAPDSPPPPKCKSHENRELAFGLLLDLSRDCPVNFVEVLGYVAPHHHIGLTAEEKERKLAKAARKRKSYTWRRKSSVGTPTTTSLLTSQQSLQAYHGSRSRTGYVGLKNLGCICYMNSTMQQFFMVQGFREAILSFDGDDETEDKDDSLMYQLQMLFAHLQETQKGSYNPIGFCHALKNWEGEPVDVYVQQDASEFLTMFFQQVEGFTQGSKCETAMKDYFGGVFSNELIAEGGRYSERPEPFYFLSVIVKDQGTLPQALETFIAGETVDYTWESTTPEGETKKETLSTIKRVSLKSLPRHLIMHLKRFDFDFETMTQIKINDRFEFPFELDLHPYTLEGRRAREAGRGEAVEPKGTNGEEEGEGEKAPLHPPEYYQYTLSGVVVHMGTANSGHYYSYIRERVGKRRWFEFNDQVVMDFSPDDLEVECFGGQETGYRGGMMGGSWTRERIRNAFMLVYDRKDVDEENRRVGQLIKPAVPAPILEEIVRENQEFWRKKNILSERYFEFMGQLLDDYEAQADAEILPKVLNLAACFTLGTLIEAKSLELLQQWIKRLTGELQRSPPACAALIDQLIGSDSEPTTIRDLILDTDGWAARRGVAELISQAVLVLSRDRESNEESARALERFFIAIVGLMPKVGKNRVKAEAYFYLLQSLCADEVDGDVGRRWLLEGQGLLTLLAVFVEGEDGKGTAGGDDFSSVNPPAAATDTATESDFESLIRLIDVLLRSCVIVDGEAEGVLAPAHALTEEEREAITSAAFCHRLVEGIGSLERAERIRLLPLLRHLVCENREQSELMLEAVVVGIRQEDNWGVKPYFRSLGLLLALDDSLQAWRVHHGMTAVLVTMEGQSRYIKVTEASVEMLIRLARNSAAVRGWLAKGMRQQVSPTSSSIGAGLVGSLLGRGERPEGVIRPEIRWVLQWLQERKNFTTVYDNKGFVLNKKGNYAGGAINTTRAQQYALAMYLADLQSLARGEEPSPKYTSDDEPESLVGARIKVKWQQEQYFAGEVTGYNPVTKQHHVLYDDGDQRDYIMAEKTWEFVTPPGFRRAPAR